MLLWSHPTCYNHSLLFPHFQPAARMIFKRINKSCYPPVYSPQIAPIATRINTKLITQKVPSALHSLASTTFSSTSLYFSFPLLARIQSWGCCICCSLYLEGSRHVLVFHSCGCCVTPLRSLFRSEGHFPQLLEVFPGDSPQLSAPLGVPPAKGSCLSQGHVSFSKQPTCND